MTTLKNGPLPQFSVEDLLSWSKALESCQPLTACWTLFSFIRKSEKQKYFWKTRKTIHSFSFCKKFVHLQFPFSAALFYLLYGFLYQWFIIS
jgi:hypothetical protein